MEQHTKESIDRLVLGYIDALGKVPCGVDRGAVAVEDLELDSLDLIELSLKLKAELQLQVLTEEMVQARTVQALLAVMYRSAGISA